MNIFKAIYLTTIKAGGCSYSFQEFKRVREGYAVAVFPYAEKVFEKDEFTRFTIEDYVHYYYSELWEYDGTYLGTWIDGDLIYLDVSKSFETLEEALEAAEYYGQKAIYDLKNGESIYLKDVK